MARPRDSEPPDLSRSTDLTAGAIARLICPSGKTQAFLRDARAPGLRVRVTPAGSKSFIFEGKLNRETIRRTIGDVRVWNIDDARKEARRLQTMLDIGKDPRAIERQERAEQEARRQSEQDEINRLNLLGLDAWADYVREGQEMGFTSRGPWSARHVADHEAMSNAGGQPFKRGKGTAAPGPLHALLARPLVKIDARTVSEWLKTETLKRPARAALAFRLLRAFLNWCAEHPTYGAIAHSEAHKPKDVRRLVRRQAPKQDALQREHLPAWFEAVMADMNVYASVYLQALLLTGARKGEIAGMRWEDVNFQFGGSLTVRDKVEGLRVIPCPPYLAHLLATLPRRGDWVFGPNAPTMAHNAAYNHRRALAAAGLPHISLHGLRRSFGTLAEWVECPAGVVAQLMGHKPSATAERHYRARPLDLLRLWHTKIETWMLGQAGVQFAAKAEPDKPDVMAGMNAK